MAVVIKAGDEIKMPCKCAVQPVTDLRLLLIIGLCHAVIIPAEKLSAARIQPFGCIIDRKSRPSVHLQKMHRSDQILHPLQKFLLLPVLRAVKQIQLDAPEDIQFPPVLILKVPDLIIISLQIHPDIGIHMPGKAQMGKAEVQSLVNHFLSTVLPVAKRSVCVKIASEHNYFFLSNRYLPHTC